MDPLVRIGVEDRAPMMSSPAKERGEDPPYVERPTRRTKIHNCIPPYHKHRTLVLCFDGTGDQFDGDNSNVVKLCELLKKDEEDQQLVYYQSGIGTYTSPALVNPIVSSMSKVLDQMIAWNLGAHVQNGYEFLMQTYRPDDNICIFGFSRGAYAARALAGMLHKVGLLPPHNFQQVPFAYRMYTRDDPVGWAQSNAFRKAFCREVEIEFMGVWDTVSSVGIIPRKLPFTTSNTLVRTFRHALALDERRAKFKASTWIRPNEEARNMATPPPTRANTFPHETWGKGKNRSASKPTLPAIFRNSTYGGTRIRNSESSASDESRKEDQVDESIPILKRILDNEESLDGMDAHILEQLHSQRAKHDQDTDIEEVWFAGSHCDVGGGSVKNETPHSLARISLRWMIRECFKANCGVMFNAESLKEIGLDPKSLYPHVAPRPLSSMLPKDASLRSLPAPSDSWTRSLFRSFNRPPAVQLLPDSPDATCVHSQFGDMLIGTEEGEDMRDCLEPAYDQLQLRKWWWFLEFLPMKFKIQRINNDFEEWTGVNLGRPREVPEESQKVQGIKVHKTVKMRMEAALHPGSSKKYRPRLKFLVEPEWVD